MMVKSNKSEHVLRSSGIRITKPRVDVYDYIINKRSHPTCEEIYDNLKGSNPSLSLATIYNVTDRLVDENLLIRITAPNGERRFDGTLDFHGHFYCESCGMVFDYEIDKDHLESDSRFVYKNIDVMASGICPNCQ
ncbi:MAG: transcriptional repressor [Clostridia bacterium]|nr:transcriptional repressor [Clostridia bacterium]